MDSDYDEGDSLKDKVKNYCPSFRIITLDGCLSKNYII